MPEFAATMPSKPLVAGTVDMFSLSFAAKTPIPSGIRSLTDLMLQRCKGTLTTDFDGKRPTPFYTAFCGSLPLPSGAIWIYGYRTLQRYCLQKNTGRSRCLGALQRG